MTRSRSASTVSSPHRRDPKDSKEIAETNTSGGDDQKAQKDLAPDLLVLLGEITEDLKVEEPIHQFLVDKWKSILQHGITKEKREELLKKYPRPENFNTLIAPKLNAEVEPLLATANKTKDTLLKLSQTQAATIVTILGNTLNTLFKLRDDSETKTMYIDPMINTLSDGAHIACDIFHGISSSRKRALSHAQVTPVARTLINGAVSDEFLLGSDFAEKWKKTKETEKTKKLKRLASRC